MNIKKIFCIILLILLLFSTVSAISADDNRSFHIDHAFIELTVKDNGLLHVDESYDYTFSGEFNGVYRNIPLKSGESVENIEVSADGAYPVLKEIDQNGQKQLKIYLYSDAAHTQIIRNCDVTVHISYDMKNVVTLFNDVGALQFKLWGKYWEVGVHNLEAVIHLPGDEGNEYYLNPTDYTKTSDINGSTITLSTNLVPKGEFYELLVLMPASDFSNATYARHVNEDAHDQIIKNLNDSLEERSFWNGIYLLLGLATLISPIIAILTYIFYGREPKVEYDGIYERDLPSDDPPAVINALIENDHNIGTPNIKAFEATILSIIDKKAVSNTSQKNEITGTNDMILKFRSTEGLDDIEIGAYRILHKFADGDTLNLSSLNEKLSYESNARLFEDEVNNWKDQIKNEYLSEDKLKYYFNNTGSLIISAMAFLGIFAGILLCVLGILTPLANGFYTIIGGAFLIIISVAYFILPDDIFGQWTKEGRTFYLKWSNFRKFLEDNSLINEHPPESIVIWRKYLIYGTALGVADNVYEAMKLQENYHTDEYYQDEVFRFHYFGGYYMMHTAFETSHSTVSSSSDSGGFGGFGGGSGGGGGGAF